MWQAATPNTRLPFLADQSRLALFSVGDISLIFGGTLIVAVCLRRSLRGRAHPYTRPLTTARQLLKSAHYTQYKRRPLCGRL
jgi:hypothetical protein